MQWLANIVPMMKKNGKLTVCVDFRDLSATTSKDMYVMPIANMLVDSTMFWQKIMMKAISKLFTI